MQKEKQHNMTSTTLATGSFEELGVAEPLLRALKAEQYETPTPIQARAIPELLNGRDILGVAQTGTGKTAAFAVPILQLLSASHRKRHAKEARALILAPTRELAIQIADSFRTYGRFLGLKHVVILGGVSQNPQIKAMAKGVDVLIATPGRLLDLVNQGHVRLDDARTLVLDEADRMLDMGFIHDVRKIIDHLPDERQSLLFSATMPPDITRLADQILTSPIRIEVSPKVITVDKVKQQVYFVPSAKKNDMLVDVMKDPALKRVILFTRTKHRANRVADILERAGHSAVAIHGNKSQNARQKALGQFKNGHSRVLVATDIAARGIDIDDVTHVINYELPNEPESYVHRIGRTARAGADGIALSFCDATEVEYLHDIERLTSQRLEIVHGDKPAAVRPVRNGGGGRNQRSGPKKSKARSKGRSRNKSRGQQNRRAA